jgi:hypothetical protein
MLYTSNPVIQQYTNNDLAIERISYSKDPLSIMLRAEAAAIRHEDNYGGCRTKAEQQRMIRTIRNQTAVRLAACMQ